MRGWFLKKILLPLRWIVLALATMAFKAQCWNAKRKMYGTRFRWGWVSQSPAWEGKEREEELKHTDNQNVCSTYWSFFFFISLFLVLYFKEIFYLVCVPVYLVFKVLHATEIKLCWSECSEWNSQIPSSCCLMFYTLSFHYPPSDISSARSTT